MKLLIVEDDPKIARALKRGFEQEGAVTEVVSDSDIDAFEQALKEVLA